jgi:Bifunctional DNA primase/polymerase, N-terminal
VRSALPTDDTPLVDAAISYVRAGLEVFPVAGKVPMTTTGFRDACRNRRQIETWWQRWPSANIGWAIPRGVLVLDVDLRHGGGESLRALVQEHGPLPPTLESETGGGGSHFFFNLALETKVRQIAGLRPGLDTRCGGRGYVVLPPSLHASGRRYRWKTNLSPAPAPSWLLEELRPLPPAPPAPYVPPTSPTAVTRRQRYAQAVLVGEAKEVANTPEGARNARLNKAWWRCAQFRDVLDRDVAERELTAAAVAAGLPAAEIQKVLR